MGLRKMRHERFVDDRDPTGTNVGGPAAPTRRSLSRRVVTLAGVIVFGVTAGGCGLIGFGGDSLTRLATDEIQRTLDRCAPDVATAITMVPPAPCVLDIQAVNHARIDQMVGTPSAPGPFALQVILLQPPAIVVNLGTNDALQAGSHPDWRTGWDNLVALFARRRCVVLTTISTWLDQRTGYTVAAEINAAIRDLQRSNPRKFKVVDWDDLIMNGSEVDHDAVMTYMVGPTLDGTLATDGIHENSTGAQWFATQDQNALAQCGYDTALETTTATATAMSATSPSGVRDARREVRRHPAGGPAGTR